jgi:Zincin-like metallopeptidase
MTWRPYLPDPRPAFKMNPDDPEPVALEVLQALRELCASFRVPPRQFRRRVGKAGAHYHAGIYYHQTDIVAVDPDRAAMYGMGGEDGYYACLTHELLHATGHPSRLNRESLRDESSEGFALEEGTVMAASRIVLEAVGFGTEALDWFARPARRSSTHSVPRRLTTTRRV